MESISWVKICDALKATPLLLLSYQLPWLPRPPQHCRTSASLFLSSVTIVSRAVICFDHWCSPHPFCSFPWAAQLLWYAEERSICSTSCTTVNWLLYWAEFLVFYVTHYLTPNSLENNSFESKHENFDQLPVWKNGLAGKHHLYPIFTFCRLPQNPKLLWSEAVTASSDASTCCLLFSESSLCWLLSVFPWRVSVPLGKLCPTMCVGLSGSPVLLSAPGCQHSLPGAVG